MNASLLYFSPLITPKKRTEVWTIQSRSLTLGALSSVLHLIVQLLGYHLDRFWPPSYFIRLMDSYTAFSLVNFTFHICCFIYRHVLPLVMSIVFSLKHAKCITWTSASGQLPPCPHSEKWFSFPISWLKTQILVLPEENHWSDPKSGFKVVVVFFFAWHGEWISVELR